MGNALKTYLLLSEKSWHHVLFANLKRQIAGNWILCQNKADFNIESLTQIKPDIIFIPHWSYIIPSEIYSNYTCIVFHMTDLPYGRGGSPLQNLIVKGHQDTKISAIKVTKGIDEGSVYLKMPLSLSGSAREIFNNSTIVIEQMITEIINTNPSPLAQVGEPILFKRRRPEESNINELQSISDMFNHIRMLDADGYPNAFLETTHFRFEFTGANLIDPQNINANVRIIKK